jgi:hypothetical protein
MTVGLTAPQAILAEGLATADAAFRLAPLSACALSMAACRMHEGSHALVSDGSGAWDVVPITAVSMDGTLVEHSGTPVSRRYAEGALLAEIEPVAFSVSTDAASQVPQLRRVTNGSSDLPVADHVTALQFEYFGTAAAPQVLDDGDAERRRTSYGPLPPPAGVDDLRDAWMPGENCVFARDGGQPAPRLAPLPAEHEGLARLPLSLFADGPWCPDAATPNRFDADLLRIRLVRIALRVQAQSASVRGADPLWFSRPGAAREAARLVPDLEVHIDVALRNTPR